MSIEDFIAFFALGEKWSYPEDFDHFETRAAYAEYCLWILKEPKRWLLDRLSFEEAINVVDVLPCHYGDKRLPLDLRTQLAKTHWCVFKEVFEPLLSQTEGQADEELRSVCFMWWDNHADEDPEMAAISRDLWESLLQSDCKDIQESALHGLGHHISITRDEKAKGLIDMFLREKTSISAETAKYARDARNGNVQ
jgi:hypothetical protein